jgi:hypothetical protein
MYPRLHGDSDYGEYLDKAVPIILQWNVVRRHRLMKDCGVGRHTD